MFWDTQLAFILKTIYILKIDNHEVWSMSTISTFPERHINFTLEFCKKHLNRLLTFAKGTCSTPIGIEVRLVSNNKPYIFGFNRVEISTNSGFRCLNSQQRQENIEDDGSSNTCQDYKIRLCCPFSKYTYKLCSLLSHNSLEKRYNHRECMWSSDCWKNFYNCF